MKPKPKITVGQIDNYVAGSSKIAGIERPIKLSSNENPLGPSPNVVKALQDFLIQENSLGSYPDSSQHSLKQAISMAHGVDPDRVICGAGSDQVFSMIALAYLNPGEEVIYSKHGFLMYRIVALAHGGAPIPVEENLDFTYNISSIIKAVSTKTRIIFIANPNNPTGVILNKDDLMELASKIPEDVILVLDSAYAEYAYGSDNAYSDGKAVADEFPNVIMTRTFSKAYGLASLRLGWGYASRDIIENLEKVKEPFNISSPAITAGIAALIDKDYIDQCAAENIRNKELLERGLIDCGVHVLPSRANFSLISFPEFTSSGKSISSFGVIDFLKSQGIIVRDLEKYGMQDYIRISIGTYDQCNAVVFAVRSFMSI